MTYLARGFHPVGTRNDLEQRSRAMAPHGSIYLVDHTGTRKVTGMGELGHRPVPH